MFLYSPSCFSSGLEWRSPLLKVSAYWTSGHRSQRVARPRLTIASGWPACSFVSCPNVLGEAEPHTKTAMGCGLVDSGFSALSGQTPRTSSAGHPRTSRPVCLRGSRRGLRAVCRSTGFAPSLFPMLVDIWVSYGWNAEKSSIAAGCGSRSAMVLRLSGRVQEGS